LSGRRGLRGRTEAAAWAALIVLNLATHFWSLGSRAMSHDESLHGFYSHQLADKGEFKHDPMMHGPLLFHASALVFLVLGESDATARVYPALAGVALVAFLFLLRRYLGRYGALLAALLLSLSPSVLFYGRYMRNDVVISLFSLIWVLAAFRYLETGRPRFVSLMALAMALCFTTKETCFIFGAIIGAWFAGLALVRRLRRGEPWTRSRSGELALVMLTLVLPFAAALGYRALGFDPRDFDSPLAARHAAVMISLLLSVSALLALLGIGRSGEGRAPLPLAAWGRAMIVFWSITVVLYTTVFTNVPRGLVSGIVGSLGYWLGEHSTGRGGQPWFYYVFLGVLYEFLPLLLGALSLVGTLAGRFGRGRAGRFAGFLAWWGVASLVAYSLAGEKMPWLLVHVSVPFCLLGGLGLGRLVSAVDWTRLRATPVLLALAAPGAVVFLLAPLPWLQPFSGRDSAAVAGTARFLFHLGAGAGLAAFAWSRLRGLLGPERGRLLALGSFGFLAALTARSALMLTFVNEDLATEFLVYAHATPDIKRALAEIEEIAARTGKGNDLEVAYDDDSAWPLTWYLRVYPKQRFYADTPTAEAMSLPVVIVGKKNYEKAAGFLEKDYVRRDYRLVWWPVEDYAHLSWADVTATLRDPRRRADLLEVLLHRRYPRLSFSEWPYRHEFRLYIRRDLAARVWPLGQPRSESPATSPGAVQFVPELRCSPVAEYKGPYAGLPLKAPAAVAVGPDGARLIADTQNHRVVVLEPDGRLRFILGGRCEVAKGGAACDGRFLEPWGVAAGAGGEIVVADTWNGRVQVFDAGGHLVKTWGALGLDQAPPIPMERLYGPRGIAVDEERERVVVSDTGHKRLVLFDREGRALFEVGGAGSAAGLFDEPVGVAVDPRDGSLLVADSWNRRIQKLGPELDALAEWPVPGWGGHDMADKPYVAVGDHGEVYASVPSQARVLVFSPGGALLLSLAGSDWSGSPAARPSGLAADPASGTLLVADSARDRVLALPLLRSATEGCR
jgi:uncharacterized protein (TIGR03663 family)